MLLVDAIFVAVVVVVGWWLVKRVRKLGCGEVTSVRVLTRCNCWLLPVMDALPVTIYTAVIGTVEYSTLYIDGYTSLWLCARAYHPYHPYHRDTCRNIKELAPWPSCLPLLARRDTPSRLRLGPLFYGSSQETMAQRRANLPIQHQVPVGRYRGHTAEYCNFYYLLKCQLGHIQLLK